ncbi:FAD-dependent monooxygenase [Nguyenibacter vanlangensis]|uniref:FAD-dependent monooxygenase n=1 Tax=Nguyenibacter vanlangensis TaxID=1216886 RepID=A0ABZ3D359_9PROT
MPGLHDALYDVVIAGAGPVGLFLACELRLAGSSVLILEASATPDGVVKRLPFGMRGLSVPTLDALHRRGLLDELTETLRKKMQAEAPTHFAGNPQRKLAGHFAGIPFYNGDIDTAKWPYRLPGSSALGMMGETEALETVLSTRAVALGVAIRRGTRLETIDQSEDHVIVHTRGGAFRGRWLVGCDGGRSSVRKLAGFGFVGTEPEFTGYTIGARLVDPQALQPGRHYTPTGMYTYSPAGIVTMVDFDGGASHRSADIGPDHLEAVLRRISGTNVALADITLVTTWTDRAYQATTYRQGRVLLAGDAAHIHSPLGGQGLNLGIGDAMNLGWKLAATIRGDAPLGLLDSYAGERHPVGAQVLDWSRAQVAIMRPSPSARAIEAIMRDLIATRDGATYFAGRVSGVSLGYDLGGAHPLIGTSVPEFRLMDGTTVGERLRTGTGLLLDFEARPSLAAMADRWRSRLSYIGCNAADRLGISALLVRPDGIVAWINEGEADEAGLTLAASRWFGDAPASPHGMARRPVPQQ